jgi:hypothetical protein
MIRAPKARTHLSLGHTPKDHADIRKAALSARFTHYPLDNRKAVQAGGTVHAAMTQLNRAFSAWFQHIRIPRALPEAVIELRRWRNIPSSVAENFTQGRQESKVFWQHNLILSLLPLASFCSDSQ